MKSPEAIKTRIESINYEIKAIKKLIKKEANFPIVTELRKELWNKIQLKHAYKWVLEDEEIS